jgi:predicted transposase YdaD
MQRLHTISLEQIMVYVNIPTHALRHSRAAQELIEEGRLEGRQEGRQQGEALGEAKATLRQLTHRCGPLSPATTARIQALPLERLEALGLALLDFSGAEDLAAWLAAEAHAG